MKLEFPILDNHIHLDPKGHGVEAARKFAKAGGSHIILVHKPYYHIPRRKFKLQYETTLHLAERIRKETKVVVHTALCPHPAELTGLMKKMPLKDAKEICIKAIDLAADYIREGIVLAFGESGRPHYPVNDEIWEASNDLIRYTMERAKELECAVQFHTEGGERSFIEIAEMAKEVGLPLQRCVKHFSGPAIFENENYGLSPSVVARRNNIKRAIRKGNRFLMETDYIDELKRPNVVLPPDTVPELTLKYLEKGMFTEDDVWMIHEELPEAVYNIILERQ